MADPLSVAAGIIGVATAAVHVSRMLTDLVRRTKDALKQVTIVLSEARDIYTITTKLQSFLLDFEASSRSQTCFIEADLVTAILAGCISTSTELEDLVDHLKAQDRIHDFGIVDRMKWATKQSAIAAIVSRLQAHKLSLSLILNVLNGMTIQGVMDSVDRLEMTVRDNQDMLGRLCAIQSQQISICQTSLPISSTHSQETTLGLEALDAAQESQGSCRSFRLDFEQDLVHTRVYGRLDLSASNSSLLTTEEPETRWSMISGLSDADEASCISVLNLGIAFSDVDDEDEYTNDLPRDYTLATSINSQHNQLILTMRLLIDSQFTDVLRTLNLLVGSQNSQSKWILSASLEDQSERLSVTLGLLADTRHSEAIATIIGVVHRQHSQLNETKHMLLRDLIAPSSYLELRPVRGTCSSSLELRRAVGVLAKVQRLDQLATQLGEQYYRTDPGADV